MATAKTTPAKKAAPAKKVATASAVPAKKSAAKTPAKKRTPNAAFMKALTPSAALAAVVGAAPLPRTEVVSKMWVYIKKHGLQDSVNKRNINADDKLKAVFGKAQVTMFELAGLIGKHLS
jgi:upstream activation factor subunit UAF30